MTYKTWTSTQIEDAPDRQWQIDTVSDVAGNTLTFTYSTTQYAGRWCVTNVERDDSVEVDFAYASDALSTVTYNDGSQATFTYAYDSTS